VALVAENGLAVQGSTTLSGALVCGAARQGLAPRGVTDPHHASAAGKRRQSVS
jgi:hypothetical protein